MDIPINIKRFAKEDGNPEVRHLGSWKGMELYTAFDPEAPYVGPPQYILVEGDKPRWATFDETEEIMDSKL
jgi:hypothetical protein